MNGTTTTKAQLPREEVELRAREIFESYIKGLGGWDKRRIIMEVEKLAR